MDNLMPATMELWNDKLATANNLSFSSKLADKTAATYVKVVRETSDLGIKTDVSIEAVGGFWCYA